MEESRYFHRAIASRNTALSRRLVKSMKESLFLEDAAASSRIEAYEPSILARTTVKTAVADSVESSDGILATEIPVDEDEELPITEMNRLRNVNELISYKKRTPSLRVFFIRQNFSWAALSITAPFFQELISTLRITLPIEDMVMYFGSRNREVEIMPPRLRSRTIQNTQTTSFDGYEQLYILRFFENNGRGTPEQPTEQWSLRQSAIYHRHAPGEDGVTWLFITLSRHAQSRLDEYVREETGLHNASPFEIHLLLLDTALSTWRQYLMDFAKEVDEHVVQVAGMSPDDRGPVSLSDATIGDIMLLDEKLLNALLVARAQLDTVKSLQAFASPESIQLHAGSSFEQHVLQDQTSDLELYLIQLDALRTKLSSVRTLLSSFLDLASGLALQNLARESRQENEEMRKLSERMHELTEKATKDAAAVKVLTILTLIYLPATVVSNFFSTSFVGTAGPSNHITVSNDWWIFVAVSVPLTAFTLYVWYVWKNQQVDGTYPKWWKVFSFQKARKLSAASKASCLPDEKV